MKIKSFFQEQLPDIDKIIKDFVNKLLRHKKKTIDVFSRDGNFNNEEPENEEGGIVLPPAKYLVTLASIIIILLWSLFGFFTVDASERAVMFRLGNPNGVKTPGLVWHMPLIEDYRIVNLTEVRRVEVGFRNDTHNKNPRESLMLTGDLNIIDMQFVVQYALIDPQQFLFENRFANERAEDVVKQVAESAMREVVGKSEIDFVLYEGRESIADETKETMQNTLNRYKTGINVREVAIQNVQPPDQVQNAFEDAIKARQDKERKINEGQAYANDILPRSEGQAARFLEDAEAYRQSTIAKADGDSARFLLIANEYAAAPEITRRRLYIETVEEVMGRANKVIIDQKGAGNILYLPLDKMLPSAAAAANRPAQIPDGGQAKDNAPTSLDELKQRLRDGARNPTRIRNQP